jgi:hypothetical protein
MLRIPPIIATTGRRMRPFSPADRQLFEQLLPIVTLSAWQAHDSQAKLLRAFIPFAPK